MLARYAVGGFCSGLVAGGLVVGFLHMLGGGEAGLPLALAAGGAVGAYLLLRDAPGT